MTVECCEFLGIRAVFASRKSLDLLEKITRIAPLDASVLIEGESGSGKEVLARALHEGSLRRSKPWVDLSCAALPENLVESELFGYEKGAFSGADTRKEGLFELADGGTLFLDEIGELHGKLQAKLLRVLDCGSYYRLGGTRKVSVNVRVLAATNCDLRRAVAAGEFRKDLYHRLAQLRIVAHPLRERREDILPIAGMFLAQPDRGLRFSSEAARALEAYSWPGNVRELRNVVITAAALATGGEIGCEDLPEEVAASLHGAPPQQDSLLNLAGFADVGEDDGRAPGGVLEQMERRLIFEILRQTNGHQERAARILGISSRTLARKLRLYETAGTPNRVSAF